MTVVPVSRLWNDDAAFVGVGGEEVRAASKSEGDVADIRVDALVIEEGVKTKDTIAPPPNMIGPTAGIFKHTGAVVDTVKLTMIIMDVL